MKAVIYASVIAASMLVACSPQAQEDGCAKAKDPTECRTYVEAGGSDNDYLLYGLGGYLLGRSASGQPTLQPRPDYRGYRAPVTTPRPVATYRAPAPSAAYKAPAATYKAPAPYKAPTSSYVYKAPPTVTYSAPRAYTAPTYTAPVRAYSPPPSVSFRR